MRTIYLTLSFCILMSAPFASAQSSIAAAGGETPIAAVRSEARFATVRAKTPIAAGKGKMIDVSLGYYYVRDRKSVV